MKKELNVLLVLVFISLIGVVSADSCAEDDRIIRLYSESNSHGALYNNAVYTYDICHNDIFGELGNGDHDCSGTNKILGLYDLSNAHAQGPSPALDNYPIDVCYGDLSCSYVAGACPADYSCVVTMYSEDNSHLADCDSAQAYPNRICCTKTSATLSGAYWAAMDDDITTITQTNDTDRVQLRITGGGMAGKEINYTVKRGIWWWFDEQITTEMTTGFTTWIATPEGDDYYFEAEVDGDIQASGFLEVLPFENTPPYVEIVNPNMFEIYYKDEVIYFNQTSGDEDDEYTTLWNFGDGGTSSEFNTSHVYTTVGQKTITLIATDERGGFAEDKVSILIVDPNVDGEYVVAHIDFPEWGTGFYGEIIGFNASSSHAINATGCSGGCTFTCTAGGCPVNTREDLSGDIIGPGTCPECRGDYSEFDCFWGFSDGSWYNASGMAGIEFNWTFYIAGKHTALLTVSKNPESTTGVEFYSFFDDPYCYRDESDETFWYMPDGSVVSSLFGNCYNENGVPSTGCCPSGSVCNEVSGDCELLEGIPGCAQYDADTCGTNNFPAEDELNPLLEDEGLACGMATPYGTKCWNLVECSCAFDGVCGAVSENLICHEDEDYCWDENNVTNDIGVDAVKTACDTTDDPIAGECSFVFNLIDECEASGFIRRTWDAIWSGGVAPAYCVGGEDQISCKSAKLVFWGVLGLIGAIIVIVIIYVILGRKGKKGKKKKK